MENKVLIAEDEPKLRALVVSYLRKEGFIVAEASNGKEAMERFEEDNFDLVILDIMMPVRDGLSVCREIRSQSMVPIVMLTARSEEYDERKKLRYQYQPDVRNPSGKHPSADSHECDAS